MNEISRRPLRRAALATAFLASLAFPATALIAQSPAAQNLDLAAPSDTLVEASLTLPDEPGILRDSSSSATPFDAQAASAKAGLPPASAPMGEASKTEKYIEPGQQAPKLAATDKVIIGFKDALSPFAAIGWLASAGYSHVTNGSPNYGTNGRAFAQRLGAAALRDSTEGIFSDSIMAPILHEDPRYYRLGPGRNFFVRLIYAGTRPVIGRTDGGRLTPNLAELSGNLAGAALTNAYYPQLNRGATQTMETFGGSLGGAAIGDVVSEFYGDVIQLFHHSHQ